MSIPQWVWDRGWTFTYQCLHCGSLVLSNRICACEEVRIAAQAKRVAQEAQRKLEDDVAERIADWMEIHGWRQLPQQIRAGEWRTPLKAWVDYVDSQAVILDQDPGDEG